MWKYYFEDGRKKDVLDVLVFFKIVTAVLVSHWKLFLEP